MVQPDRFMVAGGIGMRKQVQIRRMAVLALIIALVAVSSQAATTIAWGSSGDDVVTIQRKLKQWGYYSGVVDGRFGQATYDAVVLFQKRNGLTPDGVVGKSTADALGISLTSSAAAIPVSGYSSNEVYLLARLIYGEARGEPYVGQVAVGAVVLNRVRHSAFPNTIAGVIYQAGAFDAVADGQINLTPDEQSLRAARDAMNGWDPSGGCIYYYNPATATSQWIWSREVRLTIGEHAFAV